MDPFHSFTPFRSRTMAANGVDRASSPESDGVEYNRPVVAGDFLRDIVPQRAHFARISQLTEDSGNHLICGVGETASGILAEFDYRIRGRLLETTAKGGRGASIVYPLTGPIIARSFLVELWCLKKDEARSTMTYREICSSHIGRTLSAFKDEMKRVKIGAEEYLAELPDVDSNVGRSNINAYRDHIAFYAHAIADIDRISRILVDLANENRLWTTADLGLPAGEPADDNDGNESDDDDDSNYSELSHANAFHSDETFEPE
jgi:hypothetical protein